MSVQGFSTSSLFKAMHALEKGTVDTTLGGLAGPGCPETRGPGE